MAFSIRPSRFHGSGCVAYIRDITFLNVDKVYYTITITVNILENIEILFSVVNLLEGLQDAFFGIKEY